MREFERLHPLVSFIYFVSVIGFSMFFMHPLCLAISLVCSFIYSFVLNGKSVIKTNLRFVLPMMILAAVINPLFNHQGVTTLGYLPDGNPVTAESLLFGLGAAVMIASVIGWFTCYNQIMTSDKFIYLFGRVIPSLSMILSMVLRFVPRFAVQLKEVTQAQRCIGKDLYTGSLIQRAKNGLSILSIMITWSLENSIETADSMKSRGYGLRGRTVFSIYKFNIRDLSVLIYILFFGIYTLAGNIMGGMKFSYFPFLKWAENTPYRISVFAAYFALCICPVVMEAWEAIRWKFLQSKI